MTKPPLRGNLDHRRTEPVVRLRIVRTSALGDDSCDQPRSPTGLAVRLLAKLHHELADSY
jgi:hypothetical protein